MNNKVKLTTPYRDKLRIEKSNILIEYAKQTLDKGEMYYIYDLSSKNNETYNLNICEEGKSHEIISIARTELPNECKIGSVLRKQNGVYILDNEATEAISKQLEQILERLIQEQNQELNKYRIEGHEYEVVECFGDIVCLTDITINDGECFEEVDFTIKEMEPEMIVKYINGKYQ